MNKKTFLVTGGTGFLGSHLAATLAKKNRVAIVDIANNLSGDIKEKIKFYQLAVNDQKLDKVFERERPQIVYHLAGPIGLRSEIDSPIFKRSLNALEGLNNILDCCLKYKTKKIIFFSSGGAIYEKANIIPTPENYPSHPASLYGLANLIIERYLRSYYQKYGLNFTILRFSNVYGPKQWKNGIIPSIIIKVLKGESPLIYGKGNQTRDFLFVDDAIEASIIALNDNKNETYNVSSGEEITINEIIDKIGAIFNKTIKAKYASGGIQGAERSCLDGSKIKKELGWQPRININQGLKKTIDWFRVNYVK